MADIILAADSNWSTCNGGSPPAAGDTVSLNGFHLHLDGSDASTYTCVAIKAKASVSGAATAGYLVLDNATSTIAADLYAGTDDLITLAVGANKTLTVSGTVYGGTASAKRGIYVSGGTQSLTVGSVVGGSGANAHGIYLGGGTITFSMSGSSTGGGAGGASGLLAIVGTLTVPSAIGGSAANAPGVNVSGGTVTITTAQGGSIAGAVGALCTSGTLILNGTDLTGIGYPVGVSAGTLKVAAGVKLQYHNASATLTKFYDPTLMPAESDVIKDVSYGGTDFLGTFDEAARNTDPGESNVADGVTYKIQNVDKEGTLVGGGGVIVVDD